MENHLHHNKNAQHRTGETLDNCDAHKEDHRQWSRRQFLLSTGLATLGSALSLGGSSIAALANSPLLKAIAESNNERILVIVNLGGGNDGLNTIVPRQNDVYYGSRPTIAVQEYDMFALSDDFGMPNTMLDLQPLWNEGKMAVVHNVAYPNQNLSHFRSSDIWFSASDEEVVLTDGWIGRLLQDQYPAYTSSPPSSPIGLQIGVQSNLVFLGGNNNFGLSITNPTQFYQIAQTGQLYNTDNLPNCSYGEEMLFLRQTTNSTVRYAEAIRNAYTGASNNGGYSDTYLSEQLAIVARLIKGGMTTKVYLVSIGGFDTHADENEYHPSLMNELATSVKAFYDDIASANKSQDVLLMTVSEFGRRVEENGSFGTDHGVSAPMMLFGDGVTGGFKGTPADLDNLDEYGNMRFSTDFRQVYLSVLKDWFCVELPLAQAIIGRPLSIVPDLLPACGSLVGSNNLSALLGHNADPANSAAMLIKYAIAERGLVKLQIQDMAGNTKVTLVNMVQDANSYTISFNPLSYGLAPGQFIYRLDTGGRSYSRKMRFWGN